MNFKKGLSLGTFAILTSISLTGCGPSAEETKAIEISSICEEANASLGVLTLDEIAPPFSANWADIQAIYSGIKSSLQNLSSQASDLDDSQLARDFASVSKNAGELEAMASAATSIGGNSYTFQTMWLEKVNELTHNEALRSASDRSFIGCN